jgi:hypothetical protein
MEMLILWKEKIFMLLKSIYKRIVTGTTTVYDAYILATWEIFLVVGTAAMTVFLMKGA